MKVKTDYVTEDALGYLTPGKEYEVFDGDEVAGHIINDVGVDIFIYIPSSSHLNNHPWQIVEDTDMEPPITSECDALREEIAILETENRMLHNEINELRKIPEYPEKAVRAVWEHGVARGFGSGYRREDGPPLWTELGYPKQVARIFIEALQKGE